MIFHSLKDYFLLHVLLTDRIHKTGVPTTEFMPVVLLTDGINENSFIPVLLTNGEGVSNILTN